MSYMAHDYSRLLGMPGFSEILLKNHFTLYQGYVSNTNKLISLLELLGKEDKTATPEYAELKRRLGWEFNGMRLHELYFSNLGGSSAVVSEKLTQMLVKNYGSYEAWELDFKATGAMRGIGWVGLYCDPTNDQLLNFWINEHDVANPAGCIPILIMDVFEHAYMVDYGLKRAEYIEAFFRNIDWEAVESRLL